MYVSKTITLIVIIISLLNIQIQGQTNQRRPQGRQPVASPRGSQGPQVPRGGTRGGPAATRQQPSGGTGPGRQQPDSTGRQQPASSGRQPASAGRQPLTGGRQPPGSSGQVQPAPAGRQPAPAGRQHPGSSGLVQPPPAGRQQSGSSGLVQPAPAKSQQPGSSGRQPAAAGRQHPGSSELVQPAPASRQQPGSSGLVQPAPAGRQQPGSSGRQPAPAGLVQPAPAGRQQPGSSGRQPAPAGRQQPGSSGLVQPAPAGRQQPASSGRQPSAPAGRQQQVPNSDRQPRQSSGPGSQQPPDLTGTGPNDEGGDSEDGSVRNPRQQRIDTRNTVCETVCHCQNSGAYCQKKAIKSIPQPFPYGITTINLEQNIIESIPANTFSRQEYSVISQLKLSSNKISKIEAKTFIGLSAVQEIFLMANRIEKLEDGAFSGVNTLSTLSLSSNRLKTLNPKAFSNLINLRGLGLENNKLETIPAELFDILPELDQLAIGGNPWKCDCSLLGLFIWLQADNQLQGNPAECSSPEKLKGKKLDSFRTVGIQELCEDESDNDELTDSPSVEELVEKQCGSHNSTKPINICFISDDLYAEPGEKICLHCSATVDEAKLEKLIDPRELTSTNYNPYTKEYKVNIQWLIPESSNLNSSLNIPSNGTFCINSPQSADKGQYLCVARVGNVTDEKYVMVIIADFPNKVATGLALFVVVSIIVVVFILVRWWMRELRALRPT